MLKMGFIGVGQAGGQFVNAAKRDGFLVMALNTAKVDLESLDRLEETEKIHVFGYGGAGKDRSIGKEAFEENEDMLLEKIKETFEECQVLFPVCALGGGTGSGMMGALISLLTEHFPHKVISPILFAPSDKESVRAKMNALEAFSEISFMEDIGATFVIENQKILERFQGIPLKEKYQKAHEQVLGMIRLFHQKTTETSGVSVLDDMDVLTVLSERGAAIFSGIGIGEEHIVDSGQMAERLVKSWKQSIFSDTDTKRITRAALVVDVPEELTKELSPDGFFEHIGMPLEVFSGVYDAHDARVYTLISGLSFPKKLLKRLEEAVQKEEKNIYETVERVRSQTFAVKANWTEGLKRKRKVKI